MDGPGDTVVVVTTPSHRESSASVFPTEIYERIIDFVASKRSSQYILTACSLTCRSWFPRSRLHLYSWVALSSRSGLGKFVYSLEVNPSNGILVRKLQIDGESSQEWVSALPLTLASRLKKLSKLTLMNIDVSQLHSSFYQHLSSFSSVSVLHLFDIRTGDPPQVPLSRFIQAFPHLRKLLVGNEDREEPSQGTLPITHQQNPLALRHLWLATIDPSSCCTLFAFLCASATPLTTLFIDIGSTGQSNDELVIQSLGRFLSSCSSLGVLWLGLEEVDLGMVHRECCV